MPGAPGQQDHGGRGGRETHHQRRHVGLDVLHRVVDREERGHVAARRVDVQVDVLVGVLGLEVQQLRHDQVADVVVDGRPQEHDAVLEQARVDVVPTLAAARLLDHGRNQVVLRGLDHAVSSVASAAASSVSSAASGLFVVGDSAASCVCSVGFGTCFFFGSATAAGRPHLGSRRARPGCRGPWT